MHSKLLGKLGASVPKWMERVLNQYAQWLRGGNPDGEVPAGHPQLIYVLPLFGHAEAGT